MEELNGHCLFPWCGHASMVRGLCGNHYRSAAGMVKRGKVTWEQLICAGKCTESKGRGRPIKSWFMEGVK